LAADVPPAERLVDADELMGGLAERDRFIADAAADSALLLHVFEGLEEKRNLRREHAPGVPSWVDAEVRRAAVAWLLLLRCSSGAESGATRSFRLSRRMCGGLAFRTAVLASRLLPS
jgi:hypothetical protein